MLNEQIAHQTSMMRVINSLSNYAYIVPDIRNAVSLALIGFDQISTIAQMKSAQKAVDSALLTIFNEAQKQNLIAVRQVAQAEVVAQAAILENAGRAINKLAYTKILDTALNRPVRVGGSNGYQKTEDMFAQAAAALRKKAGETVAGGYYGNESIQDIKSAIYGTSTSGYKDGLAATAKRDFETITKTQASAAENQAKVEAFKASGSEGYVYNSITDARTSSVCRTLHGRKYIWGEGRNPVPPLHYNCRSSIVPYYSGEPNDLVGVNYYDWLERQPAPVQNEVLGETLGKVFRNAGITPDEFRKVSTNRFAEPLTIAEMASKDERIAKYLQP
jgi:SPP1 gp7 family putative phage head morphogenesis protein